MISHHKMLSFFHSFLILKFLIILHIVNKKDVPIVCLTICTSLLKLFDFYVYKMLLSSYLSLLLLIQTSNLHPSLIYLILIRFTIYPRIEPSYIAHPFPPELFQYILMLSTESHD